MAPEKLYVEIQKSTSPKFVKISFKIEVCSNKTYEVSAKIFHPKKDSGISANQNIGNTLFQILSALGKNRNAVN